MDSRRILHAGLMLVVSLALAVSAWGIWLVSRAAVAVTFSSLIASIPESLALWLILVAFTLLGGVMASLSWLFSQRWTR